MTNDERDIKITETHENVAVMVALFDEHKKNIVEHHHPPCKTLSRLLGFCYAAITAVILYSVSRVFPK